MTILHAWERVPQGLPVHLTLVGGALDDALAAAARALQAREPRVRWLGARPHGWTRQAIKRAHLLIVPSRMEGGANVIVEAVTSGTPVLASRVPGNVGMLGREYRGYFPLGDHVTPGAAGTPLPGRRAVLSIAGARLPCETGVICALSRAGGVAAGDAGGVRPVQG